MSVSRYCFLAFGYEERVVADRETCRQLLLRLKLDNWVWELIFDQPLMFLIPRNGDEYPESMNLLLLQALGKTKVFLKYYHVEYLAKQHDHHVRRVIQVQACVRRWLAKLRLQRGNISGN